MHLEEAIERLQQIVLDIENKQLPLHEIMSLHEEGQKLVNLSESLLKEASKKLEVKQVAVDSQPIQGNVTQPAPDNAPSDNDEISLF